MNLFFNSLQRPIPNESKTLMLDPKFLDSLREIILKFVQDVSIKGSYDSENSARIDKEDCVELKGQHLKEETVY